MTNVQHGPGLDAVFRATLARLDPAARVKAALQGLDWSPQGIVIVAAGKAARAMTAGALDYIRDRGLHLDQGVVIVPEAGARIAAAHGARAWPAALIEMVAGHPVPDRRSVEAGRAAVQAVQGASHEILALISGGASALMALPAPGLLLADVVAATSAVYQSGASIQALNTVRKHLSAIKGGQLAALAAGPITTLVASDVVGDDMAAVGSGPTIADPGTFAQARDIVGRTAGWARIPSAVRTHLEQGVAGKVADTPARPRPGDRALLVAGTGALMDAACAAGTAAGMQASIFWPGMGGDVHDAAQRIVAKVRALAAGQRRNTAAGGTQGHLYVAGGETTISVPESHGTGGRAQHLALLLARDMAGVQGVEVLVAGSDGIDGNSPAAGAVIDGRTWDALQKAGIDGALALDRRDAHTALARVDACLFTGPTGINHADLVLVAARP